MTEPTPSSSDTRRVCFVGIDGATWRIIEPMVEAGRLPNLAAMMERGSHGILRSTLPPNSSLAWTSFQTGVHPGKHGIFFFREQREGTYLRPVVTSSSIQAPTLWTLASEQEKRVAALYFPMTYPPEPVNGCMVGGLLTPDRHSEFIHPPELRAELTTVVGDVPSDNEPEKEYLTVGDRAALESLVATTKKVTEIGLHVFENHDWDLFAIVFRAVDLLSHRAWRFQDPDWAARNPEVAAQNAHILGEMYELIDAQLGEFRRRCDANTALVVASDHGFGPITHRFHVNRWLRDEGYLVLKRRGVVGMRLRLWLRRKGRGLLRRLRLLKWLDQRKPLRPDEDPVVDTTERMLMSLVDWRRTRAYSAFSGGEDIVLINLEGRQPDGLVRPGAEYEELRREIMAKLAKVEAPDGTRLVDEVYRREDLWQGQAVRFAPDIQFITRATAVQARGDPLSPCVAEPALDGISAMHSVEGVLLMEGAGVVREGGRTADAQIADMCPTLLHLLGLPVEDYMDGAVIEDVLEPAWLKDHPVAVRRGNAHRLGAIERDGGMQACDEEKLTATLRALGYLE